MDYTTTQQTLDKLAADCIYIGVFEDTALTEAGQTVDRMSQGYLSGIIDCGDITGKLASSLLLHDVPHVSAKRVCLVGLGKQAQLTPSKLYKALKAGFDLIKTSACTHIADTISAAHYNNTSAIAGQINQAILACNASQYQFTACKNKQRVDAAPVPWQTLTIVLPETSTEDHQHTVAAARAMANGINLCKDLANLPGNICTPTYLAEQAKALSKKFSGFKLHLMEEKEMHKKNMGALLSVARGSEQPAKLITLEYHGGASGEAPVVLVGKGVTFDSGGISIKPPAAMDEMKYDMCGAASVLGTLSALAELQAPINVVGIIPATENLPSGNASKPGDIVTTMSGQTVEILNTDAEGRLILCDAMTYALDYKPAVMLDIATLTGAMVVALGHDVAGLFSNDDALAETLRQASLQSEDPCWQLPLWAPYQERIDSPFADMANVGDRSAGSITAACFLARFTESVPWAHLDIAGVAWTSGKQKGATGRPVSLLTQFCLNRCQTAT